MFQRIFLFLIVIMLLLPLGLAHTGQGETINHEGMSFFHYGSLSFPAWTYYAEIIIHIGSLIVAISAALLMQNKLAKSDQRKYAVIGLSIIAVAELLTVLHHFLILPFGILNAVINHILLLIGLVLIAYSMLHHVKR
ncbi:hypothetical protein GOV09_02645 [Candidatus Woesearchaeota archaeon]|nr:hypothetical protein [Candidatus Woesearchaeota archaeon]